MLCPRPKYTAIAAPQGSPERRRAVQALGAKLSARMLACQTLPASTLLAAATAVPPHPCADLRHPCADLRSGGIGAGTPTAATSQTAHAGGPAGQREGNPGGGLLRNGAGARRRLSGQAGGPGGSAAYPAGPWQPLPVVLERAAWLEGELHRRGVRCMSLAAGGRAMDECSGLQPADAGQPCTAGAARQGAHADCAGAVDFDDGPGVLAARLAGVLSGCLDWQGPHAPVYGAGASMSMYGTRPRPHASALDTGAQDSACSKPHSGEEGGWALQDGAEHDAAVRLAGGGDARLRAHARLNQLLPAFAADAVAAAALLSVARSASARGCNPDPNPDPGCGPGRSACLGSTPACACNGGSSFDTPGHDPPCNPTSASLLRAAASFRIPPGEEGSASTRVVSLQGPPTLDAAAAAAACISGGDVVNAAAWLCSLLAAELKPALDQAGLRGNALAAAVRASLGGEGSKPVSCTGDSVSDVNCVSAGKEGSTGGELLDVGSCAGDGGQGVSGCNDGSSDDRLRLGDLDNERARRGL